MPGVKKCQRDGKDGWKAKGGNKCYLASEEGSEDKAKRKAFIQSYAIEQNE